MASSAELINDLVNLTQGAMRNLELQVSEIKADLRVQEEKLKNKNANIERLEKSLALVKADLERAIAELKVYQGEALEAVKAELIKNLEDQKEALEKEIENLGTRVDTDVEALKEKLKSLETKHATLAKTVEGLEKAHSKYLGIVTGASLLIGFLINILPKLLSWI